MRLLDTQGEVLWQSSTDETAPLTDIRQDRLRDNDVLKTLVHSLEEQQIKTLLGEEFGGPQFTVERRTETLRKQLAQFAWEQRALTFESRYQTLERLDDPLAEAITRLEPGLPVSVTRELLGTANGDELLLISEGHVPPRQQQLVQLASQEVRIARAFEGLELDCVNNADSHTLALHSLKALPGWTATVRIEIRERYYEGALLDSTGPATAPQQKVIVRNADGTYQPFDDRGQELHGATDFYSSVLHALPDAERQALNVQIGQANTLKDAIRAHPLERSELRLAIAPSPIELPAVDTLRLVGSDGYRRIERVRPAQRPLIPEAPEVADILPPLEIERGISLEDRAREIYPGLSIEHAQAFVTRLETTPLGARGELSRLSNEYAQLATDLHRWAHDIPLTDPVSGRALSRTQRRAARRNRAIFKEAVQRCWRRETHGPAGYTLELREPIIGDLPTLDADLSFVSSLTISGTATTDGLDSYMQNFPGLRFLEVQNFDLQNLPQSIASMPNLQQLIARNCGLTVSPASQQILSSLPALTLLDLMDNPLAVAPDIQAMRSLKHLNLANTGISTLPVGLLEHPNAIVGRFDGNRISELPGAFFTLSAERSENFDFAYNPLSAAMRERVKIHYNRTGRHFGVLAELADIQRARTLFPELDTTEATGLLYRLRGTLVQGREQLTRWEAELVQLTSDLTQWSSDIPEVNPISGLPLDGPQRANTQAARTRFGQQLERAWRTRSRQTFVSTLLFVGELPRLSADFGHVDGLTLIGNNGVSAVPEFLGHFQGLRHVSLHEFALGDVPHTLTSMPQLETLVLENCAVALTPQSQTLLSSLKRLDTLELTKNPLGLTPDLASLPGLTYLDLSGSEISTVPAGLAEHAGLITALLSDNRISELPESLFELSADRSEGIDFGGNPLSTESRDAIKRYFQKTGQDFGVQANADDIAVAQALFPSMDGQDASDLIYDLPGTLQAGHLQLQRWRVEFKQMLGDLRIWERNVPDVHPVTGEPLSAAHMYAEHVSRAEFSQHLEAFWRRRSAARVRDDHFVASLNFWGDMPELTTDFSHVSNLALDGNNVNRATGSFLDRFANVHTLEMKGFALERLPQSLSGLTALQDLNLRRCRLTLTPENQTTLSSLSNLQHLNLSDNPLGAAPDLDALTSLTHLHLSHTGIAELPGGLIDAQNLITAILDGNQISELPDALFDIFPEIADGINLGNNPISSTSRERIKAYYRRHGQDFAVLAERADIDRARELSSGLSIEEASQMIYSLPGTLEDGRAQLTLWEAELFELGRNLAEWADDIAGHDRTTGEPVTPADLNAQKLERSEFSHGLTEFWRKRFAVRPDGDADTFMTVLAFNGELPALAADFKHVSTLSLTGNRDLSIGAGFLDGFTGLQQLELRAFQLGRLPEAIKGMPALERLTLSNCAIVLDADSRSVFSALPRLEALDLCSNPLGQVPDIAALPALTYIDLSSTGIDQLPAALATHPALEIAILSSNRIAELPPEFYDLPAQTSEGFDVGNNPLTEATREQIKRYYRQSEEDFGVLAALEDIDQVKDLYPGFSSEQASEFVYRLPGSLAEGRLELARKLAELQALLSDLTVWTTDIPNHPVTREPLAPPALLQEQYKRRLFKDSLELCWRRVQTSALQSDEYGFFSNQPILGDLPVLTADFGHVREVYLTTPGSIAPLGAGRFLEYFPNLTRLTVRGYPLQSLPDAVFNMKALQALSLPECGIRLTQATVDALSGMTDLNSLNLRNNPLGMSLDLSNLSELIALDLSNAELTEVPQGLFTHTHLRLADLSNNLITAMPIELMEANPALTANFNFNGNPLSPQSLQRVVAHYYETGNPLGIPEATGMPRPADLPPDVEMES